MRERTEARIAVRTTSADAGTECVTNGSSLLSIHMENISKNSHQERAKREENIKRAQRERRDREQMAQQQA